MNWLKNNLSVEQIKKFLPHRDSFLLVDRVTKIVSEGKDEVVGRSAEAIKCLSISDPVFAGHFPDDAIFPGVLQVEAMSQTAGFCLLPSLIDSMDEFENLPKLKMYLMSAEGIKFRHPARPGDQLILNAEVTNKKKNIWQFCCSCKIADQIISEAKVLAMVEIK